MSIGGTIPLNISCKTQEGLKMPIRKPTATSTSGPITTHSPRRRADNRASMIFRTQFSLNQDDFEPHRQSLIVPSSYDLNREIHEPHDETLFYDHTNKLFSQHKRSNHSNFLSEEQIASGMEEVVTSVAETKSDDKKVLKENVGCTTKVAEKQKTHTKNKILVMTPDGQKLSKQNPKTPRLEDLGAIDLSINNLDVSDKHDKEHTLKTPEDVIDGKSKDDFVEKAFNDVVEGKLLAKTATNTPRVVDETNGPRRLTAEAYHVSREKSPTRVQSERPRNGKDKEFLRVKKDDALDKRDASSNERSNTSSVSLVSEDDDDMLERVDGVTYTWFDKKDVDIMISSDENKVREYLKRNRVTVGFPIKGYEECLVLDIRNGDDNPMEQIKEIRAMMQKRKEEFMQRHGDEFRLVDLDKNGKHLRIIDVHQTKTSKGVGEGIVSTEQELVTQIETSGLNIPKNEKKSDDHVQSPDLQTDKLSEKENENVERNALNPSENGDLQTPQIDPQRLPPELTGFEDITKYFSILDDTEKEQYERYKNVMTELWLTEESHVQSLDVLFKCYLVPLSYSKYSPIVQKMKIQIGMLYDLHSIFYKKISQRMKAVGNKVVPMVADLMRYFFHFVKATCPYIVEYNANLRTVNELMHQKGVKHIVERSIKHYKECHEGVVVQRIQSYLIMPIQRIPRYVLLIKDMLKCAPPITQDTDTLVECYQVILDVAAWINETKLYEEEREKYGIVIKAIPGLLDMNKSCRRYILSGVCKFMTIEEDNGVREAYFFLFNDVLIETKIDKMKGQKVKKSKLNKTYAQINQYETVEDFEGDVFQVQQVYMISEDAIVSYCPNPSLGPSVSFTSVLYDVSVTLVFGDVVEANAWFVAMAYTIKLAPRINESKIIYNIRNE
ncbi:Rho/RAC guanine nucleotide exchange factor, putative [Entamoeba invadens IP1]|uniref:Rho/RAC guanine nucleotide exchange factor, putative n=1 Tax=Entamoeba invadens IP1 TaxID=370355 RepID=A0A0A1UHD0_ENTIV|nr:Rho/RAC guanine nucleotide exchange factor, putative [Entamoeba invadens IP1]ELP95107.1 Rho/RAC guanine nucleotide exchange factor, putative [Entamoeba invadens IP1]|eukprot:XP_004261878.1 Rho/RAC guanine nucleotide exchange factor, putative [Entamoeba invadens IP1]